MAVAGEGQGAALAKRDQRTIAVQLQFVPMGFGIGQLVCQSRQFRRDITGQLAGTLGMDRRRLLGDLGEAAPGRDAALVPPDRIAPTGRIVIGLDQQPVLPFVIAQLAALHQDQVPVAGHAAPVQTEMQMALFQAARNRVQRLPPTDIPQHDRACPVIAFRDQPLEAQIRHGMILGSDRKPLFGRIKGWAACDRPAQQDTVPFQT